MTRELQFHRWAVPSILHTIQRRERRPAVLESWSSSLTALYFKTWKKETDFRFGKIAQFILHDLLLKYAENAGQYSQLPFTSRWADCGPSRHHSIPTRCDTLVCSWAPSLHALPLSSWGSVYSTFPMSCFTDSIGSKTTVQTKCAFISPRFLPLDKIFH